LQNGDCETVLREIEIESKSKEQRLIIEVENGTEVRQDENGKEIRQDVPLDFASRRFSIRRVRTDFFRLKGVKKDDGNILNENDFESEMPASAA
jgi:hypothetical protein